MRDIADVIDAMIAVVPPSEEGLISKLEKAKGGLFLISWHELAALLDCHFTDMAALPPWTQTIRTIFAGK